MKLARFILSILTNPVFWGWAVFIGMSVTTFISINPTGFMDCFMITLLSIMVGVISDLILFIFCAGIYFTTQIIRTHWRNA